MIYEPSSFYFLVLVAAFLAAGAFFGFASALTAFGFASLAGFAALAGLVALAFGAFSASILLSADLFLLIDDISVSSMQVCECLINFERNKCLSFSLFSTLDFKNRLRSFS